MRAQRWLVVVLLVAAFSSARASDSESMESRAGTPPAASNQGAAAGESLQAADGVPATVPDPATGGEQARTAAQVQDDVTRYGAEVQALQQRLGSPTADMESLVDNLAELNREQMVDAQRAKDATGWRSPRGPALPFELGIGAESDIDYPEAFPTRPQVVRFVTGGKNRLAGLDSSLKRASKWMNKHTCGGFNWTAQFRHAFRTSALLEYLEQLPEGVAAALPMALIGAFSPQLAEIVKHLKLIASFDISAAKADCHAIESALTSGLRKDMWGEAYAECLERYKSQGIRESMANCKTSTTAAVKTNDNKLVNPDTSAAASDGGWLTDSFSTTQDKLRDLYGGGADPATTGADALAGGAGDGSLGSGPEQAAAQGTADATRSSPGAKRVMDQGNGGAMESMARSLWGSVRIHASGALEVGRKSIQLFSLRLATHAARVRETLQAQLIDHFALLTAPYPPTDELIDSYAKLKQWTFQSRGGGEGLPPWLGHSDGPRDVGHGIADGLSPRGAGGDTQRDRSQRITDETMDACAYLLGLEDLYAGNPTAVAKLKNEYRVDEFLNALAQYECWLYIVRRFRDDYQRLMQLTQRSGQSGHGADQIAGAERDQFTRALAQLEAEERRREAAVLDLLPAVNAFRPQLFKQMYQQPGASPSLTLPAVGFVSE